MSRKTTAALIAALGINFAMAGGAIMLANLNKPAEYDASLELANDYGETDRVAGIQADAQQGDLIVPLKAAQRGGNTRVTFSCGKQMPAGREVHEGTWDQISGAVLYRPGSEALLAIEAVFDTRSLRTDAQALTTTVTTKEKWFDLDNHPAATFRCDQITPIDAASPSHTHDLSGTFTLNGITKPITIPAKITFSGQAMELDAEFVILRSDYQVDKRSSSIAGVVGGVVSEVDDAVQMKVRFTAAPDLSSVLAELAAVVESQQEQLREAKQERERLSGLTRSIESLQDEIARLASAPRQTAALDVASLPQDYIDRVDGGNGLVPFEMVLVPGDEEKGINPVYMAKHEVTWGMFRHWMYCEDLSKQGVSPNVIAKLIMDGHRPSPMYEDPAQLVEINENDKPAMSMSLLTARAYCKWLSEQTGRQYRLPTIDEWQHAMRLGGGLPEDFDRHVLHEANADENIFGRRINNPVGSKAANDIGLHDMFGSVAEWVTGTGADRVIVGGSFLTPKEDISETWQMIEDQDIWNEHYPGIPASRFWYIDTYYTGIRLVCEPASVAANPPKASD